MKNFKTGNEKSLSRGDRSRLGFIAVCDAQWSIFVPMLRIVPMW